MEHVCVQTIVLGVLQKWMSHFALLDGTTERRPLAVPSRFPHANMHWVLSLLSPRRGTRKNFFDPKKCAISFLSNEHIFKANSASRQRVSSTPPCPDAVAPGQRQAGMEQMESWQGLRCPCISSICSLLRTFACFI